MTDEREMAMILILEFFRSKMAAMSKSNISKVKELVGTHEISVNELVDKYVQLVYANS